MKRQQEDLASSDEYSDDKTTQPVLRQQLEAASDEAEPAQSTSSSYVIAPRRCPSERAMETVAAADMVFRQQDRFDSPFADRISSPSSGADFHQFVETEDWLLECPAASVSRPPLVERTRSASLTSSSADAGGSGPCSRTVSSISEQETVVTVDDDRRAMTICTTRYTAHETVSTRPAQPTPCTPSAFVSPPVQYQAVQTPRVRGAIADCNQRQPRDSRIRDSRAYGRSDALAVCSTRTSRDGRSANVAAYQSPFARGYVPSGVGTSRSPCSAYGRSYQSSQTRRQSPTYMQQVVHSSRLYSAEHRPIAVQNRGRLYTKARPYT